MSEFEQAISNDILMYHYAGNSVLNIESTIATFHLPCGV
jgi:hypothetical protein